MKKQIKRRSAKKIPLSHHVRASLVTLAPHASTGRRLSHRHTTHGALLLILAMAGAILTLGLATIQTNALSSSQSVTVTATVNGHAPTVGAIITSPADQTKTNVQQQDVSGTCPTGTYVAVYHQGTSAGSTTCTDTGTFTVTVQLSPGVNMLQAQDYDINNQPGPTTDPISVEYIPPPQPTAPVQPSVTIDKTIIPLAVPKPVDNPCFNDPQQQTPLKNQVSLTVSCMTKDVYIGQPVYVPVSINGGSPPYALTIDWGDDSADDLHSFSSPGNYIVDHVFRTPQIKKLSLRVADANGTTYAIQTVVQVNGSSTTTNNTSPVTQLADTTKSSWLDSTIPIYGGLAILVFGFWIGDIFQRLIRARHPHHRKRHA
jgi:hypothetical protein